MFGLTGNGFVGSDCGRTDRLNAGVSQSRRVCEHAGRVMRPACHIGQRAGEPPEPAYLRARGASSVNWKKAENISSQL